MGIPASAQSESLPVNCDTTESLRHLMTETYNEEIRYSALTTAGSILEIYGNDKGWSAIMIYPDGTGCFLSAGETWIVIKELRQNEINT